MSKKLPLSHFTLSQFYQALFFVAACFYSLSSYSQATLIKDINTIVDYMDEEYSQLTSSPDGTMYFVVRGRELWKANGTSSAKIKTFTAVHSLLAVGTVIYFVADDGATGLELWKSEGAAESTVRVKDIYAGTPGSYPQELTAVNGELYFSATTSAAGRELWKSNGTAGGTVMVKDVFLKKGSSNPSYITNVNGTVYFTANDGVNGYELWKTDASGNTVMVKDILTGSKVSSAPEQLARLGSNQILFTANNPATGRELWKSDGTADGTVLVKDIRPGTNTSAIKNVVALDNIVMFTATDGVTGQELWKSDGTESGTILVKDMTPGSGGSHGEQPFMDYMGNFTNINGVLFYTAYAGNNYFIWKSDGTSAGTVAIQPCQGPGIGRAETKFTLLNDYIYYINETQDYDWDEYVHLWRMKTDGTGLEPITEFFIGDFYNPYHPNLCAAGSTVYFTGRIRSDSHALYASTGAPNNVTLVVDAHYSTMSSEVRDAHEVNNKVVFVTSITDEEYNSEETFWTTDGTEAGTIPLLSEYYIEDVEKGGDVVYVSASNGLNLWKTDGTAQGTVPVKVGGSSNYNARELRYIDGILYFTNYAGELWRSNGTSSGTYRVKDLEWINDMNGRLPGRLIFRHRTSTGDDELWRSNGTAAGTYKLKTLNVGPVTRAHHYPTATIGNTHYFVANDGTFGNELWKTGGTASSTMMVTDLNPNDGSFVTGGAERDITEISAFKDTLFISAADATGQWNLFKSTGTATGTRKFVQMPPVFKMIPAGEKMFMLAYSSPIMENIDLWVTDGTSAGTKMIMDMNMPTYMNHSLIDGFLYFSGSGNTLWRSDGTECGTVPLDISPAVYPGQITKFGNSLFMAAYGPSVGGEPFKYDLSNAPDSPCGAPVFATSSGNDRVEESRLSSYPNPFTNDFALRVKAENSEHVSVQVSTLTGHPVERFESLDPNEDHLLGQNWMPGVYIIKVTRGDKTESKLVVKK